MLNSPLSSIIVLTFHLALSNVSPTSYSCNNCYIPEGSTWSHQPWSRLLSTCFLNFLLSSAVLVRLLLLETNKETMMTSGCWCWLAPRRQKNSQKQKKSWSRLLSTCFFNFLLSFLFLVQHLTVNGRIHDGPRGASLWLLQAKILVETKKT